MGSCLSNIAFIRNQSTSGQHESQAFNVSTKINRNTTDTNSHDYVFTAHQQHSKKCIFGTGDVATPTKFSNSLMSSLADESVRCFKSAEQEHDDLYEGRSRIAISFAELQIYFAQAMHEENHLLAVRIVMFDRYLILRVLIDSLFGFVVEAVDLHDHADRSICIKISNTNLASSGQNKNGEVVCDDILREAAVLRYLHSESNLPACLSCLPPKAQSTCNLANLHQAHDKNVPLYGLISSSDLDILVDGETNKSAEASVVDDLPDSGAFANSDIGLQNICPLLEELQYDECHLMVYPFFVDGDLFEQLKRNGPFEPEHAKKLFRQLVHAVRYMHKKRSIAHMDLSLENVCCDHDKLYLIDFGTSSLHPKVRTPLADELQTFALPVEPRFDAQYSKYCDITFPCQASAHRVGKRSYMSPEMFACLPFDAYLNDNWALGIILYIMLTGVPPFEVPSPEDVWFRLITGLSSLQDDGSARCWLSPKARALPTSAVYNHLPDDALDLVDSILRPEASRPTIDKILEHPWLQH